MRPILFVFAAASFAASLTGARANLSLPVDKEVGTLTCAIRGGTEIIKAQPSAECTFVSDRDDATQSYVAQFRGRSEDTIAPKARTVAWRVLTRKGVERPGMLAGIFSDPASWQVAPSKSAYAVLVGPAASLRPILPEGQATAISMQHLPDFALVQVSTVASR